MLLDGQYLIACLKKTEKQQCISCFGNTFAWALPFFSSLHFSATLISYLLSEIPIAKYFCMAIDLPFKLLQIKISAKLTGFLRSLTKVEKLEGFFSYC